MQEKITREKFSVKGFLTVILLLFALCSFAQTYEFENGTRTNSANIQNCDACSNKIVGNLGGDSSVSVNVSVTTTGWYNLQLFYCTGDPRTIRLTAGSATAISIPCDPSGGWSTAASKNISVYLNSGTTTLLWDNTNSWAPNLDKFVLTPMAASTTQTVNFGTNNSVVYNLTNKTYNVKFNGATVITNASAYASSDQQYVSSNFASAVYSTEAFTDNIGSGTKHIFTLSGNYTLGMQQIFYTYTNKNYLAVQVVLTGNGSNCYKMSPLTSYQVTPNFGTGDTRAVFVPYDNDAWVRYNAYPLNAADFTASEVTNIYNNTNRKGLVIGSLEHTKWKTGITVNGGGTSSAYVSVIAGWTKKEVTRDTRGHGWVNVGQTSCPSPKVIISANDDWRTGFEEFAQANAALQPKYIFDWTAPKPMGWNSWGAMQTSINLTKVNAVVDFFKNDCPAFKTEDNTLFIDLDSYWDNMSDAQLAQFVTYAKSKGFKAGIYWAPFVDWGKYNRQVEGSSYNYNQCWTTVNGAPFELDGAYAMDPTSPGTKARIHYFINRFKAAGFEMVKVDFLTHASIEADSFVNYQLHTGMEAYQEGMKYLVDEINGTMLVEAAISPNIATGPYVHMRRIACDAYSSIGDSDYTLNSTTYGWWQNQIYDYLDADHVVFGTVTAGENRARLLGSVVTGTITTGDDFSVAGAWKAKAQSLLQNTDVMNVAKADVQFRPADGNTGYNAANVFSATKNGVTYVAVFNYSNAAVTNNVNLSRLGLGSGNYTVKELYSGATSTTQGTLSVQLPQADAALYAISVATNLSTPNYFKTAATNYVFPNPASSTFRIKFDHTINGPVALSMYDTAGKEVWKTIIIAEDMITSEVPVNGLAKGVYMIKASTEGNSVQNFKFVKN
ncbi:alpha-galactosidase [Flavobacterium sp. 90]|uniref:T9SS type A sorting domain-containing protein n=1 Tax=unclassified Flavobacterium TaxID=196869 RepID=UPI000EB5A23D|nr:MULTISPECIES: T9SS type A sorting domain-containing protein [unclassified Flavobacterium]RKR05776.1 alpha-galactosidase [Flavobacterium sp. 81]TCK57086.1 alpha-galactosidase [Flavobacterium sp. 90]